MSTTIQDVINAIVESVPAAPRKGSVDTLKTGDPAAQVTGIVTTFIATVNVIKQAAAQGANLIITHEPTYYNHRDETEWLGSSSVYETKRRLIEQHKIAIFRFHDYWHLHQPDGIVTGVVEELGWNEYINTESGNVLTIPSVSLVKLAEFLKQKLDIASIRAVGDPGMNCSRIGLLVGVSGGETQIEMLQRDDIDVLICGETVEWQVCEYARDAVQLGVNKALIILGHANSEEAGMKYVVEWLRPKLPEVPMMHIPSGDPIRFM